MSRGIIPQIDEMLNIAKNSSPEDRVQIIRNALTIAQNDYFIIPLFQNTKSQLINPTVKGYDGNHNHLGLEQSKWYHF